MAGRKGCNPRISPIVLIPIPRRLTRASRSSWSTACGALTGNTGGSWITAYPDTRPLVNSRATLGHASTSPSASGWRGNYASQPGCLRPVMRTSSLRTPIPILFQSTERFPKSPVTQPRTLSARTPASFVLAAMIPTSTGTCGQPSMRPVPGRGRSGTAARTAISTRSGSPLPRSPTQQADLSIISAASSI
jgi:hypothetical protein